VNGSLDDRTLWAPVATRGPNLEQRFSDLASLLLISLADHHVRPASFGPCCRDLALDLSPIAR
jgi:hypothetical protein